jgi:DNA-binding GntR family transcriptional regulator
MMRAVAAESGSRAVPPWPGRQRPQLADEVVQYVRALITSGEVAHGSFLRLEKLARELDMSTTPVREAMAALEREGFVRLEPRRGYVVSGFSRQDISDIFMVEAFVASELAARAATLMSPETLAALSRVYEELQHFIEIGDYDQADDANFRFYWLVHDTARSPKLTWLVSTIVPYSPHGYTSNPELRTTIVEGHGQVLKAIANGDADQARQAIARYVRAVRDHVIHQFERAGTWSDRDIETHTVDDEGDDTIDSDADENGVDVGARLDSEADARTKANADVARGAGGREGANAGAPG